MLQKVRGLLLQIKSLYKLQTIHTHLQMDIQHHSDPLYSQYKNILSRARSFPHLLFYNRKLINTYLLATHGFKLNINRQGKQQAKCISCGNCILLDPIIEEEGMEIKQGFKRVLVEHQSGCSYGKQGVKEGKVLRLVRPIIGQFGLVLFQEILASNQKIANINQVRWGIKQKIGDLVGQRWQRIIMKLVSKGKHNLLLYMTSLFGWLVKNSSLVCQYCGQYSLQTQSFNPSQCHRQSCLMLTQKSWQPILQKLAIKYLSQRQGEFLRTEGEVYAKKIRQQLEQMSDQSLTKLKQFRYRIKDIKRAIETMDEEEVRQTGKRDRKQKKQEGSLDRVGKHVQQLEQLIRVSIKRVKIW